MRNASPTVEAYGVSEKRFVVNLVLVGEIRLGLPTVERNPVSNNNLFLSCRFTRVVSEFVPTEIFPRAYIDT